MGSVLLAGALGVGLGALLALAPSWPWLLLALVALTALGTDKLLRAHSVVSSPSPAATASYVLLPSLIVLAAGLLARQVAEGASQWLAAALTALALGAAIHAEYLAAEGSSTARRYRSSPRRRDLRSLEVWLWPLSGASFLLQALAYLTALALFAFIEVSLKTPVAIPMAGLVASLLAVELLRSTPLDTPRQLAHAFAIGLLLLEARWALAWLPLSHLPAALLLLLLFYLATGLVLTYRREHLDHNAGREFAGVGIVGLALVVAASLLT